MTNLERIQNMNAEEMAKFMTYCGRCSFCHYKFKNCPPPSIVNGCEQGRIKWLESEVTKNGN